MRLQGLILAVILLAAGVAGASKGITCNGPVTSGSSDGCPRVPTSNPRVVTNLLDRDSGDLDGCAETKIDGGIVIGGATPGESATATLTAAGRVFSNCGSFDVIAGRTYAASATIISTSGNHTAANMQITLAGGVASGSLQVINPAVGRAGFIFVPNTSETGRSLRVGVGTATTTGANTDFLEYGFLQVEEIPPTLTAPSEPVQAGMSAAYNYDQANTLVGSVVTDVRGANHPTTPQHVGLIMGDSQANDLAEYPTILSAAMLPDFVFYQYAAAGRTLSTGDTDFTDAIDLDPVDQNVNGAQMNLNFYFAATRPDFVISQLGVNDISVGGGTSLAGMLALADSIHAQANAYGVSLVLCTVAPFKEHGDWTQGKQDILDAYNLEIKTRYSDDPTTTVADLYTLLEDPATPDTLLPAFSLDFKHWSLEGNQAVAAFLEQHVRHSITR